MTLPKKIHNPDPAKLSGLDVLRGLAILSVILFHCYNIRAFGGPWWTLWLGQGAEGVGLFYLLSALTLRRSWNYRQNRDRAPVKAFWARRFFRIAPLFYLMLLVSYCFTRGDSMFVPPSLKNNVFTWTNLVAHLTFVFGWIPAFQNSWIGVEWSIGVEMTFYLLFPWIIRRVLPRIGAFPFFLFSLALAWFWSGLLVHLPFYQWPSWAGGFLLWSFPTQMVWFAGGLWIGEWRRPTRSSLWSVLWALLAGLIASQYWPPMTENLIWLIPNLILAWLTLSEAKLLRCLPSNRFLRYLGQRSYSLYLIHWPVLTALVITSVPHAGAANAMGLAIRIGAVLAVSIPLAEFSYRAIEKPAINFGRRWIRQRGWAEKYTPPGAPNEQVTWVQEWTAKG